MEASIHQGRESNAHSSAGRHAIHLYEARRRRGLERSHWLSRHQGTFHRRDHPSRLHASVLCIGPGQPRPAMEKELLASPNNSATAWESRDEQGFMFIANSIAASTRRINTMNSPSQFLSVVYQSSTQSFNPATSSTYPSQSCPHDARTTTSGHSFEPSSSSTLRRQ